LGAPRISPFFSPFCRDKRASPPFPFPQRSPFSGHLSAYHFSFFFFFVRPSASNAFFSSPFFTHQTDGGVVVFTSDRPPPPPPPPHNPPPPPPPPPPPTPPPPGFSLYGRVHDQRIAIFPFLPAMSSSPPSFHRNNHGRTAFPTVIGTEGKVWTTTSFSF